MKIETAINKLIKEFGTPSELANADKLTKIIVEAAATSDVSDHVFNKMVKAGHDIKKLGLT